jgi:[ribosomal protein S5]-alanine N-acetyltransferase
MTNTPRFIPFPVLLTAHFRLRELHMSDEHEIFILRTDEGVNRFLDRPLASSIEDVRRFIQNITENLAKGEAILWAIEPHGGGALVGTICFWNISWPDAKAEIGYELLPRHQGKGVMKEVLPVVVEYGFGAMGLGMITAEMSEGNVRSARLLERHGFVRDGMHDGMVIYTRIPL